MIKCNVSNVAIEITETETLTAGRVGLECQFTFSSEWDGLAITAYFLGSTTKAVVVNGDTVTVPAESMAEPGYKLYVGVVGKNAQGNIVIPTLWASAGKIKRSPGEEEEATPSPDVVAQIQLMAMEALEKATYAKGVIDDNLEAITEAGETQTEAVNTEGSTQVLAIQTESSTQQAAIAAAAAAARESIPEDYTALSDDVDDLKSALPLKAPAAIDTGESSGVLRIKDGAEGGKVMKITLSSIGLASETVTICGKNLVKSVKNGYYDTATGDFVANNTWRATDYIRCNAGESFYASSNAAISSLTVLFYDKGGAYLGYVNGRDVAFIAPENAFSMALYGNRTALTGDFQVEPGAVATEFESYRENSITIDFDGTESDAFEVNNPELTTFYGVNSVWSQNGGISIAYSADTGLFVGEKNSAVDASLAAVAAEIKRRYTFPGGNNNCTISAGDKIKITNNSVSANASASTRDIYGNTVEAISSNIPKGGSVVFTASSAAEMLYFYSSDNTATFSVEFLGTIDARIEALEGYHANPIPDYYQPMIASKTQTVRENMMSVGKNGDTFVFITDIHWQNNRKNSPALIKYLINNLNIDKVFIGGDLITQGERNVMASDMLECVKAYSMPDVILPIAFGNHDSNWVNYGTQRDDPTRHFDINAVYALICKQAEPYVTFTSGYDCGLYFDNSNDKTRYIFLDTGEDDSSYRVFTAFDELAETLIGTPDGFKVVIVAHIVTYGIFTANIEPMLDAYNAKSTYAIDGKTYDFSEAKGRVVIAIGGHTHVDSDHTTSGGIPVVVTTCDRIKSDAEVGTTDEQAFEVVTLDYSKNQAQFVRIGRGANRTFTLG